MDYLMNKNKKNFEKKILKIKKITNDNPQCLD